MKRLLFTIVIFFMLIGVAFAVKPVNYDTVEDLQISLTFNVVDGNEYIPILATMTGKALVDDDEGERIVLLTKEIGGKVSNPATPEEIAVLFTMTDLQDLFIEFYEDAINYEIVLE